MFLQVFDELFLWIRRWGSACFAYRFIAELEIPVDFLAAPGTFCENHTGMKLQLIGLIINQEFNIDEPPKQLFCMSILLSLQDNARIMSKSYQLVII